MARTAITAQTVTAAGLDLADEAANVDGNQFGWTPRRLVRVVNGSAGEVTVTIPTPAQVAGLDVAERTVAVPAGGTRFIGPFPPSAYRQADGSVHLDYSAVTSVTVAVLELERV